MAAVLTCNRKVKVAKKNGGVGDISEISNQVFSLEYNDALLNVENDQKVKMTLTNEANETLLEESDYVMVGTRMDSIRDEQGVVCVSFGGLLGRFKIKGDGSSLKWYVYVKK